MKKLISKVLTVVIVAGTMCNVVQARAPQFAQGSRPSDTDKNQKEGLGIKKRLDAATMETSVAADKGVSDAVLEEKTKKVEKIRDEAMSFLERTKRAWNDMTLVQKSLAASAAAATVVIGSSYALQGKSEYAKYVVDSINSLLGQAKETVGGYIPESVSGGWTSLKGRVKGWMPWSGNTADATQQVIEAAAVAQQQAAVAQQAANVAEAAAQQAAGGV